MDKEITFVIDPILLLELLLLLFFVTLLITVMVVRYLFYKSFKKYQKWLGKEVYKRYTEDMDKLDKHYNEALALEEIKVETNTEFIKTAAKKVDFLAARIEVMERIFDKIMGGVYLIDAINTTTKKSLDKVRSWTKFRPWTKRL